jgi:2-isopropylmalate synthase
MTIPAMRSPTLAAVEAGARQVQGTLNGLGERCGNANLTTLIPTLAAEGPMPKPLRNQGSPRRLEADSQDQPRRWTTS